MKIIPIGERWKTSRTSQNSKWKNYEYIEGFENALTTVRLPYNISISYYDTSNLYDIQYHETTPFTKQIKLTPRNLFLSLFPDTDIWRRTDIDSSIISRLGASNKYAQPDNVYIHNRPYILFALQSLNFTSPTYLSIKDFIKVMIWAEQNKIDILFKLHPYNTENDLTMRYWESLRKNNIGGGYVHLIPAYYNVDRLIENSEGVWTHSSGVGFQALIYDKPVVNITRNVDWSYVSNVYTNPLETKFEKTDRVDLLRFLSWYYHKLTIDSTSYNLSDLITTRIISIVENNFDIEKIYG